MPSQAWRWLFNTQLYIAIPGLYKTAFDVNPIHVLSLKKWARDGLGTCSLALCSCEASATLM